MSKEHDEVRIDLKNILLEWKVKAAVDHYLWAFENPLADVRGARFALARSIEEREPGILKRVLSTMDKEND